MYINVNSRRNICFKNSKSQEVTREESVKDQWVISERHIRERIGTVEVYDT